MEWENKTLSLKDISRLYLEKAGEWLLLEILETDPHGNPIQLKLLKHSENKDELHDFMMEHDEWTWERQFLIVLADPNKPCTIG